MRSILGLIVAITLSAVGVAAQEKERSRLKECGDVLKEILDIPDGIPKDLLDKAECVMIFPS
ncbi:MAG TPA: hypothetical protein VE398_25340, partial [Acidobacteriota bacterium]|nr:hypothetical protein [Acidobacteriota bacterium]